jgi:hypothetical protein
MRFSFAPLLVVLAALLAAAPPVRACKLHFPLREPAIPTLSKEAAAHQVILYGHLDDARKDPSNPSNGTTDLVITTVLKNDPALGKRRKVQIPRYLPIEDARNPPRFLLFADVSGGKVVPVAGRQFTQAALDYLKGILAIDPKDRVKLLRYCFDYLDSPGQEVARDASLEFTRATDREIAQAAKGLPASRLRRWLQDPRTTPERLDMYGWLLGNCGGGDLDAELLRKLLGKMIGQKEPVQPDGLLIGYVLLRPKDGWAYVLALLKDSSAPFSVRYSGLRAARFFEAARPGFVPRKDILKAFATLIGQGDMADLPIDYLRQRRCWDLTEQILPLFGRESHKAPIVRRTILRYTLQCPDPQARAFVATLRRQDREFVEEIEEGLKLEAPQRVSNP